MPLLNQNEALVAATVIFGEWKSGDNGVWAVAARSTGSELLQADASRRIRERNWPMVWSREQSTGKTEGRVKC